MRVQPGRGCQEVSNLRSPIFFMDKEVLKDYQGRQDAGSAEEGQQYVHAGLLGVVDLQWRQGSDKGRYQTNTPVKKPLPQPADQVNQGNTQYRRQRAQASLAGAKTAVQPLSSQ